MEREAFKLLHDMEDSWWYRGRASVVRAIIARTIRPGAKILDFGAGYGGMYPYLSTQGSVYAFEPDSDAANAAHRKSYKTIFKSEAESFNGAYDLIGLFDVLEHIEDDQTFLHRAHKALRPNGALLITVPAMPFLWSRHDVLHHHYRRYTRSSLIAALQGAGYHVEYVSFWNMLMFLPAALLRLTGASGESSFSAKRSVDSVLYGVVRMEVFLMRFFRLPFGISLTALARKSG